MKRTKKKNTTRAAIEKFIAGMTKSYQNSLIELVEKIQSPSKSIKTLKAFTETETVKRKKSTTYELFLDTLKKIGRPAMTKEIASRFKKIHPEARIPKNKKAFMQTLYNSASYLSKEGLIERTPVGKKSYEYSLKAA